MENIKNTSSIKNVENLKIPALQIQQGEIYWNPPIVSVESTSRIRKIR